MPSRVLFIFSVPAPGNVVVPFVRVVHVKKDRALLRAGGAMYGNDWNCAPWYTALCGASPIELRGEIGVCSDRSRVRRAAWE